MFCSLLAKRAPRATQSEKGRPHLAITRSVGPHLLELALISRRRTYRTRSPSVTCPKNAASPPARPSVRPSETEALNFDSLKPFILRTDMGMSLFPAACQQAAQRRHGASAPGALYVIESPKRSAESSRILRPRALYMHTPSGKRRASTEAGRESTLLLVGRPHEDRAVVGGCSSLFSRRAVASAASAASMA